MEAAKEGAALKWVLPVAVPRFLAIGASAPALSWVDFASAAEAWGSSTKGCEELQAGLRDRVMKPALVLLHDLVLNEAEQGPAIRALQEHVSAQLLPHLGVPQTRRGLRALGVALYAPAAEFPRPEIREECWVTGVEGAV
mmetsp:Transcript_56462/g.181279  ORF Transcript_56462/g.181279 Transcript_56462/m.181279 type:complete len:140 (-) Transcript_56462:10-429(-)